MRLSKLIKAAYEMTLEDSVPTAGIVSQILIEGESISRNSFYVETRVSCLIWINSSRAGGFYRANHFTGISHV